jgi:hypothetical protein
MRTGKCIRELPIRSAALSAMTPLRIVLGPAALKLLCRRFQPGRPAPQAGAVGRKALVGGAGASTNRCNMTGATRFHPMPGGNGAWTGPKPPIAGVFGACVPNVDVSLPNWIWGRLRTRLM